MPESHRIKPGSKVKLAAIDPDGKELHADRAAAETEFAQLREELAELQHLLYADGRRKVLIVFQAMDCGGKDGTIRHVFRGVNPQGVRVSSFKAPTAEELSRDFLWRIHREVPGKGMIRIFNRSHYEDVLVVRVENLVPEPVWRGRYDQINQFEQLLHESGTLILKFYLHISKKEQKKRLEDRLSNPHKRWKFEMQDLVKRAQWDEYQIAYEEMLASCSTPHAPWYVIPSDQKWYRNLAVTRAIVEAMRKLELRFPPAPDIPPDLKVE